jgi:hypothetical protein
MALTSGAPGEGAAGLSGVVFRPGGFREFHPARQAKTQAERISPRVDDAGAGRHEASMAKELPRCPYLPEPRSGLDWRALHAFRERERGVEFYRACLEYAQVLWRRGLPARALLCLDRAFGADLTGHEPELKTNPLPYRPLAWILRSVPAGMFIGNPRVHFQHYADRMNEPRRDCRRWRAWACWAIARELRPDWPGDPRHVVVEPSIIDIEAGLRTHGHKGEVELWQKAIGETKATIGYWIIWIVDN